jgi:hypothetical protein
MRTTIETNIRPAHVIHVDEDDVWRIAGLGAVCCRTSSNKNKKARE